MANPLRSTLVLVSLTAVAACGCDSAATVPPVDASRPGDASVSDPGDAIAARYEPLDGFPQMLDDGRLRTRYELRSPDPTDVWKFRCFQPDRFTDLSDPSAPRYDDADWGYIEFDVVEPVAGRTEDTYWMVLLDSGGMSIAEDARWTTPLDASDPQAQDQVIMPWPGSVLAEGCAGEPVGCPLYRSARVGDEPPDTTKANERGLWRVAADRQWTGDSSGYQGFERAPNNGLVEHLRRTKPEWGFVEVSGCARDNFAGDPADGPHRDRVPWGFDALLAVLDRLEAEHSPRGLFFTGASSGGVATMAVASRLADTRFADSVVGFIPDAGGADYDAFRRHKDAASDAGGWHYLEDQDAFASCQSTTWTMGQVFDGVTRHLNGYRVQERLPDVDGECGSPDGCLVIG